MAGATLLDLLDPRDVGREVALTEGGRLGARVAVLHTPKKGRIVIEYRGNEDLQRVLEKLGVTI